MTERGLSSAPRAPPRAHSAAGDPVGAVAAREYAAMNSPELLHQAQRWFGLAPLLIIALACSSSEGQSAPPGGQALYVVNSGANSVAAYAPGASGDAAPTAVIHGGSHTGLNGPPGSALDAAGNIYGANYYGSSITVYAPGASGNATPTTTIAGSNTGLSWPWGIARDAAGNLYVVNSWSSSGSTSITVYAAGASGNATPSATITGNNTGLSGPHGIALDAAGRLYVANGGSNTITVYAPGTTGNA